MADILIRNLDPSLIKRLKLRAGAHHRSLQGEVKYIIEKSIKMSMDEAKKTSASWQKRLTGQIFSDSAELQRKDRDR